MNDRAVVILAVVARIPRGRVATYGQIALIAGFPGRARQVGAILRDLADEARVPWFRVLGASGRVSERGDPISEGFQRHLLEEDGVEFLPSGRVDLRRYGWDPFARTKARSQPSPSRPTSRAKTAPSPARPASPKTRATAKRPARSRASGQKTRT
jgi:methylated-DNA-protein-cysteine methyltransferase related protein